MKAHRARAATYHVRVPARVRQVVRVAPRPVARPVRAEPDEPWSEIEALLTAPHATRRRLVPSRIVKRAVAGLALVIAAGGLALGSVGLLSRVCDNGTCGLDTASATAPASPRLAMVSEPRADDATIAEGRSVAGRRAAGTDVAKATSRPIARTASADRVDSGAATDEAPSRHGLGHRHRHHDRRAWLAYRQAWR